MQSRDLRPTEALPPSGYKSSSALFFSLRLFVFSFVLLIIVGLCGCESVGYFAPEGPPIDRELYASYDLVNLRITSSAEALATIHRPEYELLSQSKSVVASLGQKKDGYKTWFSMVSFGEQEVTARRKYLLIVDEKAKVLLADPRTSLRFYCSLVLERELLEKPYANDNARRIAIVKDVLDKFITDTGEVTSDNKLFLSSGALIKQALAGVLVRLGDSPGSASRLTDPDGLDFSHINLDRGKIRMVFANDVVSAEIVAGSPLAKWRISLEDNKPNKQNK